MEISPILLIQPCLKYTKQLHDDVYNEIATMMSRELNKCNKNFTKKKGIIIDCYV